MGAAILYGSPRADLVVVPHEAAQTSPLVPGSAALEDFADGAARSAVVLAPYKLDGATQQISLLRVCDASHAYVVWTQAQTQNVDGSVVTPTTSSQTAGTLPANQSQSANNVVSIPSSMVTSPMIPSSPDGSNVCTNLSPSTSNTTQVGTAGGWLYMGQITYQFTPTVSFVTIATTPLTDTIYMVPRLY